MKFRWEAQSASCYNSDCTPNNSIWKAITEKESGITITSSHNKSTLILTKVEPHSFYRCTANNSKGEDSHVWKVVPVKGYYIIWFCGILLDIALRNLYRSMLVFMCIDSYIELSMAV